MLNDFDFLKEKYNINMKKNKIATIYNSRNNYNINIKDNEENY